MMGLRELLRPYAGPQGNRRATLEERIARRIDYPGNDTDCWLWRGCPTIGGYGQISADGGNAMVHRVVYELLVGPIPEGLTLDHQCHNADLSCVGGNDCLHRRCANPGHLEPATMGANTLRGRTLPARNAVATHCVNGHEFTLANTYVPPRNSGFRFCRRCRSEKNHRYYLRRKEHRSARRAALV